MCLLTTSLAYVTLGEARRHNHTLVMPQHPPQHTNSSRAVGGKGLQRLLRPFPARGCCSTLPRASSSSFVSSCSGTGTANATLEVGCNPFPNCLSMARDHASVGSHCALRPARYCGEEQWAPQHRQ